MFEMTLLHETIAKELQLNVICNLRIIISPHAWATLSVSNLYGDELQRLHYLDIE
jgi:hypothetical protein